MEDCHSVRCLSQFVRLASRCTQMCADRATPFCCIRVSAGRCRGVLCIREPGGDFTEMYHDTGRGPDAIRGPIWAARDVHGRREEARAAKTVLRPGTASTVPTQVCVRNIAVEGVPHAQRASASTWKWFINPCERRLLAVRMRPYAPLPAAVEVAAGAGGAGAGSDMDPVMDPADVARLQ